MTDYYRAEITLSHVIDVAADANGYAREQSRAVAHIDVTAGSAGSAMVQVYEHVKALRDWHTDEPVPRNAKVPQAEEPTINLGAKRRLRSDLYGRLAAEPAGPASADAEMPS